MVILDHYVSGILKSLEIINTIIYSFSPFKINTSLMNMTYTEKHILHCSLFHTVCACARVCERGEGGLLKEKTISYYEASTMHSTGHPNICRTQIYIYTHNCDSCGCFLPWVNDLAGL